jgi:dTDP-4-amino-4,6-dideoxygalactose transaminase
MSHETLTMQKIPFLDLKKQYLQIKDEIHVAINEVLDNTAYSHGPFVEKFEKNLASYCGTKYALGVNTGTSALHLAMLALNIGEGDEVIIPANTFIATAWGVSYVNATPVFVDCDPVTWNIDPSKIEEKITDKTKAIIGVHLYGQPFNVDAVAAIAKKHNLYMVEDCAQAIGAKYKEVKVGGFGEMGCFSFYPGKNLGAYGEGGGITTNNESYYKHIQSLRNHGSIERYYHDELGYNMRMDGIQGAILDVKLKYIDGWNARRKEIAGKYQEGISNTKIKIQAQPEWSDSIYHLFVITTEDRDGLMKYLQSNNIFPGLHYPVPVHLQKVYSSLGYKKGDFPNSEYLAEHCLSLPMFSELSDQEVERVTEVINQF